MWGVCNTESSNAGVSVDTNWEGGRDRQTGWVKKKKKTEENS